MKKFLNIKNIILSSFFILLAGCANCKFYPENEEIENHQNEKICLDKKINDFTIKKIEEHNRVMDSLNAHLLK
jgi:hypothetical protein